MDDVLFIALAGAAVRQIDEKYGRPAAWLTAIVMVVLPLAAIFSVGWWLLA